MSPTAQRTPSAALDGYNPPQKLYRETEGEARRVWRGQGPKGKGGFRFGKGRRLKFHAGQPRKARAGGRESKDATRAAGWRAKLGITEKRRRTVHYDAKVRRGRT